ncbi:sensor domain-containing protein [Domibacillus epiphyticus]|uniref:GGDEF domain-containing protein n=1 Tax=Domibacillus epiphyticus TaxID=1714355 RepID=A0A1V2A5T4_9BACI|nr:EAL domain-containing protein [Domibacillus epiphyticus]OMP66290.1 hypothetical protein BTO28_12540 [Domibacillus epiphyticus]
MNFSNSSIEIVLESITDAFYSLDNDLRIEYINRVSEQLLDLKREEVLGNYIYDALPHSDINKFVKKYKTALLLQQPIVFEEFFKNKWYEVRGFPSLQGVSVYFRDITRQREEKEKMYKMAYYDGLTQLPNRYYFMEFVQNKISTNEESYSFSILFMDLDRFKVINETYGHKAGDRLLKAVAKRLGRIINHHGLIARYSGDEFLIFLKLDKEEKIARLVNELNASFLKPFRIDKQEIYMTAKTGISQFPKDGQHVDLLIKQADIALYHAKKNRIVDFIFFQPALSDLFQRNAMIESELRKAILYDQIQVYYQPKIELESGKIYGVEALSRWEHPRMGFISPEEFIPIAEESGLIHELGSYVLKKACKQLKVWHESGYEPIQVSVNVSARQFENLKFIEMLKGVLNKTQLSAEYLELEITESIIQNITQSQPLLNELKAIGISLSIDDFGIGYSSLSKLRQLPIDSLKIDRTFINDLNTNDHTIVKTIIEMGHNLHFNLVAEGIENKKQLEILKRYNCQYGQGYLFSKPLPVEEVEHFLTSK